MAAFSDTRYRGDSATFTFYTNISKGQLFFSRRILERTKGLTQRFLFRFSGGELLKYLKRLEAIR